MNKDGIKNKLNEIFRDLFDDNKLEISENTTPMDIEDWDSLSNIDIVLMVESEFNIKISTKEMANFITVGDLIEIISSKMN